jgi:hypothetical protein
MSVKIGADHLARTAVVYVRQSTMTQVLGNLESQNRRRALAKAARIAGFTTVTVIPRDLGTTISDDRARASPQGPASSAWSPISAPVPSVRSIVSRRHGWRATPDSGGRDWHHLVDLCALTGAPMANDRGSSIWTASTTHA